MSSSSKLPLISSIATFSGSISTTSILLSANKSTSPCFRCVPCGSVNATSVPLSDVFLILTLSDSSLLIFIVSHSAEAVLHISSYFWPRFVSFLMFPIIELTVIIIFASLFHVHIDQTVFLRFLFLLLLQSYLITFVY